MNNMYYLIDLGENMGLDGTSLEISIKNIIKSKNTIEHHRKNYYKEMVKFFSQFEECYVPENYSDIKIKPLNYSVTLEIISPNLIKITIGDNIVTSKAMELSYGVRGGLNMGFSAILIPVNCLTWHI